MTNALFLYYANKKAPMELDFKNEVLLSAQQVLLTDLLVFASEDLIPCRLSKVDTTHFSLNVNYLTAKKPIKERDKR